MLAKKLAVGFGIAILLPMLVHFGVSTFSPEPKWENDFREERDHSRKYQNASAQEREKMDAERDQRDEKRRNRENRFQMDLFLVSIPVGLLSILAGSLISIQSVGAGLMFGGLFTITDGYYCNWRSLESWVKFVSFLLVFLLLIFIGYRKCEKQEAAQ